MCPKRSPKLHSHASVAVFLCVFQFEKEEDICDFHPLLGKANGLKVEHEGWTSETSQIWPHLFCFIWCEIKFLTSSKQAARPAWHQGEINLGCHDESWSWFVGIVLHNVSGTDGQTVGERKHNMWSFCFCYTSDDDCCHVMVPQSWAGWCNGLPRSHWLSVPGIVQE